MKTKLNIAIVALAATMTSCYDVLDKVPTDRYTDAVVCIWQSFMLVRR